MGLLTSLFRSVENPAVPLSQIGDDDLATFGSNMADSGVSVTKQSALEYSAVWRGINLLARDVAKLPVHVYRKAADGRSRDTAHPAEYLIRHKANDLMKAFDMKMVLVYHAILCGNGYAFVDRDGAGRPVRMMLLDPAKTVVCSVDGRVKYVTYINGEPVKLEPFQVFHMRGLSWDGICGYDVITLARRSFGLGIAAEKYGAIFFKNNARAQVVIEHPGTLSVDAQKKLVASWNSVTQGINNAHKTAILEEGMKIHEMTINARDAQLMELRQFEIRSVANWIGVPPHKLGDTTRTAFASLEQENQSYLDEALDFWLTNYEEEARDKLLTEKEKRADTHFIEFTRQALVRANLDARGNYYQKALGGVPWMQIDEVRHIENMNDLPNEDGKGLILPQNITGAPAKDAPPDAGRSDAVALLVRDAAGRMARRVILQADKARKASPDGVRAKLESGSRETVEAALAPVAQLIGADKETVAWLASELLDRASNVTDGLEAWFIDKALEALEVS